MDLLLLGVKLTAWRAAFDPALDLQLLYLSEHIRRLKQSGIPVKRSMIKYVSAKTGRTSRYAEYFLTAEDIAKLKALKVCP